MRRRVTLVLRLVLIAYVATVLMQMPHSAHAATLPTLRVSSNGRYLVTASNQPFFYLADTAWELFHRLNRSQAVQYLQNRADLRFTVVQAVALAELDGLNTSNAYGDRPLLNNNPATPATTSGNDPNNATEYDYWDHVDYIVDQAAVRGIYTALLPTWADKVLDGTINTGNAQIYGQFLGNRYGAKPVIWVLGGDRGAGGYEAVWRALAKGIAIGTSGSEDYSQVLMTYHPPGGGSSATWFHNDTWLDFNSQQNGHCTNTDVWNRIASDYGRTPTKPVVDLEPLYEDHPICFNAGANGYSNDYEIRKFAYWDVFAGALGHTYGHHSVWQMYEPGRSPINGPQSYWYDAINRPGAAQMQHLRTLIEARPMLDRVPDQSIVVGDGGSGASHVQATRGTDYLFVYSPLGNGFSLNKGKISGGTLQSWWYNPRTGVSQSAGTQTNTGGGTFSFTPPSNGSGNDWVLVLDDQTKGYAAPGTVSSTTPTPTPTQAPIGSFTKGINFNGDAVTIEGNAWQAYSAALGAGLNVGTVNLATTSVTPNPSTTSDTSAMLNSAIWTSGSNLSIRQNIANGSYNVYLWVVENYQSNYRSFNVNLEGSQKASAIGNLALGSWQKYGPYTATVADGTLNIDLIRVSGDVHVMGLAIFQAGSSPTPTPAPSATPQPTSTPPAAGFLKGVNFNGGAVTIEGNAWQAYSAALSAGLNVGTVNLTTTSVTPNPSTTSDTSAMLNSAIWRGGGANLNITQSVANGDYTVFLWVIENYQSNYRSFNVNLEGSQKASAIGNLALGNWQKYGPYTATVSDGTLNIDLIRVSGDIHVMGLAIFQN